MKSMKEELTGRMEELKKYLPEGVEMEYVRKHKNNRSMDGYALIRKSGNQMGIVCYYEPKWDAMSGKELMESLLRELKDAPVFSEVPTKEWMLKNVRPMVMGMQNAPGLQEADIAYKVRHPFLVLYQVPITIKEGLKGNIKITNRHLKEMELSLEELDRKAFASFEKEIEVIKMIDILNETLGEPIPVEEAEELEDLMYVITNTSREYGAAGILNGSVLEKLKEIFHGDFVVLPSSVHECIATYYDPEMEYTEQVRGINEEIVCLEDKLCDHAFLYHSDSHAFEVLEEKKKGQEEVEMFLPERMAYGTI